jgi:hypothetical protein
MIYYYNVLSRIFFIILLFLPDTALGSQHLVIYRDFGHKGDENQFRGVVNVAREVELKEFNIGQEEDLKSFMISLPKLNEKKPIVLGVGEKTVIPFSRLLPLLPVDGITTVHLCHMVTANHSNLLGKVNFLALPVHAIGEFEKEVKKTSTQLIKTIGVSHNRQIKVIEQVYREEKAKAEPSYAFLRGHEFLEE